MLENMPQAPPWSVYVQDVGPTGELLAEPPTVVRTSGHVHEQSSELVDASQASASHAEQPVQAADGTGVGLTSQVAPMVRGEHVLMEHAIPAGSGNAALDSGPSGGAAGGEDRLEASRPALGARDSGEEAHLQVLARVLAEAGLTHQGADNRTSGSLEEPQVAVAGTELGLVPATPAVAEVEHSDDERVGGSASHVDGAAVSSLMNPLSRADMELSNAVEQALIEASRGLNRTEPLVWETGWVGYVLGSASLPILSDMMPSIPSLMHIPLTQAGVVAVEHEFPPAQRRAKRRRFQTWAEEEEGARQRAFALWHMIVEEAPAHSKLGRQISECYVRCEPEAANQLVRHTFASKATGALVSRATSMLQYLRWRRMHKGGIAFPVREEHVYDYALFLEAARAPPSRPPRVREALQFAIHVIGLDAEQEALDSRRIAGAAAMSRMRLGAIKQRPPFTVSLVQWLEEQVAAPGPSKRKVFLGYMLVCVRGRLRFNDGTRLSSEPGGRVG